MLWVYPVGDITIYRGQQSFIVVTHDGMYTCYPHYTPTGYNIIWHPRDILMLSTLYIHMMCTPRYIPCCPRCVSTGCVTHGISYSIHGIHSRDIMRTCIHGTCHVVHGIGVVHGISYPVDDNRTRVHGIGFTGLNVVHTIYPQDIPRYIPWVYGVEMSRGLHIPWINSVLPMFVSSFSYV